MVFNNCAVRIFGFLLFGFYFSAFLVSAGVGIYNNQEAIVLPEGESSCITYGLTNPFEFNSEVEVMVSGEPSAYLISQSFQTQTIPAGTFPQNAVPVELCFKAPENVFPKNCALGLFLCEKKCLEEEVAYSGSLIATESSSSQGSGSSASAGVSVPLNMKVVCSPYERSYLSMYIFLLVLLVLILAFFIIRKMKNRTLGENTENVANQGGNYMQRPEYSQRDESMRT